MVRVFLNVRCLFIIMMNNGNIFIENIMNKFFLGFFFKVIVEWLEIC